MNVRDIIRYTHKINISEWIYNFIFLIVLGTLFQSYLVAVNIILVFLTILFTVIYVIKYKIDRRNLVIFTIGIFCCGCCWGLGKYNDYSLSPKKIIYYLYFLILYFNVIERHRELENYIKTNKHFLDMIIIVWNVVVGISALCPSCYGCPDNWGNYNYFFSIVKEGGARLGSCAYLLITIILVQISFFKKKRYIAALIIPLYTMIACGSRTYLIICIMECIIILFVYCDNKYIFELASALFTAIVIIIAKSTTLGAKMESVKWDENSLHNIYDTFSNGRFSPVFKGIDAFIEEPVLNKVFGNGWGYIEEVLLDWVFNDFIEICLIYGLIGLTLYIYCIKRSFNLLHYSKIPWYIKIIQLTLWFGMAFWGLYYRMPPTTIGVLLTIIASLEWKKEIDKGREDYGS